MPRLQVLNGKRQGAIFEIEPAQEMVIGHRQSAQITIDDPWVSWDHAKVVYDTSDATCWIEDMNSTNGTFVNCERVKREQLRHEDIVFLGKTHVIFLAPIEDHSQALFEHSSPSSANAPNPLAPPPGALHVSSAQGFMHSSGHDALAPSAAATVSAEGWSGEGGRSKSRDPFEDSSVDPFSSDPHDDELDWNRAPDRPGGNLRKTRPESDAPSPSSASQPRLNLNEIQSDADLNLPGPSPREISNLLSESDSFDDLNDILGDGRAVTPSPSQIPPDFRKLKPQDLGEARTLPISDPPRRIPPASEESTRRDEPRPGSQLPPSALSTQPLPRDLVDPGLPGGAVPADAAALAFERARLEDEVRRLRAALEAASLANPAAVQAAVSALRDVELGRLARRVADLEAEVAGLKHTLSEREAELDAVTEEMIRKEDELDTLSTRLRRGTSSRTAPPLPQPTFDPHGEDLTSLEF
ncbi:MAG: FHA domain-containing protein [Planctomycetes bacterium]|nr:FHA domain-containing protein [Planctomycetota bacterium]